jgi:hypothetical protein
MSLKIFFSQRVAFRLELVHAFLKGGALLMSTALLLDIRVEGRCGM